MTTLDLSDPVDRKAFDRCPSEKPTSLIPISLHCNKNHYRFIQFLIENQEFTNASEAIRSFITNGIKNEYGDLYKEFLRQRLFKR